VKSGRVDLTTMPLSNNTMKKYKRFEGSLSIISIGRHLFRNLQESSGNTF
jgi:hypothetical protein